MSGDAFRDAISALADGEDPGIPLREIEEHLTKCSSCREFAKMSRMLRPPADSKASHEMPDLSKAIVRSVAREDRNRISLLIRFLLATNAVLIVLFAFPDFLSTESGSHAMRHVGAFSIAYAVGLLTVVDRPARARTMFGVSVVLVAALTATTIMDVIRGSVGLLPETVHLLELASAVLLWELMRVPGRTAQVSSDPTGSDTAPEPGHLQLVEDLGGGKGSG